MVEQNGIRRNKKEERKYLVFGHIVRGYVSTASPVSSKTIAGMMSGSVSSATVRNIMSELEEQGYLEQPHTSAGRIPTDSGYRHYVDMILDRIQMKKEEAKRLAAEYDLRIRTMKDIIERTSFLLSRELRNAGIVMWPSIGDFYLKHMELIRVSAETVLAVLITVTNVVKNHLIKLDEDLEKARMERIANYVNKNYGEHVFSSIPGELKRVLEDSDPEGGSPEDMELARSALGIMDSIMKENIENEIYWQGLNYFMDEPEFRDAGATRNIFRIFSEKDTLVGLMRRDLPHRGLRIHIGGENDYEPFKECSIVTCGYTMRDRLAGRIGVIGPRRMDYYNALRTVSCLADLVSEKLVEIDR